MKNSGHITGAIRWFVNWLAGISYLRLGTMYAIMIGAFGCLYYVLATFAPHHGPSLGGGPGYIRLFNGMYFSIVTAASVGYGDIAPHGISKIIASLQSLLSLFIFAILVSKPISERQEAALNEMHALTLDQIFTTIREGLFIMRKDFDGIVMNVAAQSRLSEYDTENFITALQQGHVLLGDIVSFYDTEQKLYVFDVRREKLLAESVKRTIERLRHMLDDLSVRGLPLPKGIQAALEEFLHDGRDSLGLWKDHSSKTIHQTIDESLALLEGCQTMVRG